MLKWIIFFVLLISGGILTYLYKDLEKIEKSPIATSTMAVSADALPLLHSYKNGTHHYIGSIKLPNSCHSVTAEILRDDKFPEIFDMRVTTTDLQTQTPLCSQLTSRYQFSVDAEGQIGRAHV